MKLLVTGGAGFIGSNFILYILGKGKDYEVVNFDTLTYAGNLANLKDVEDDPRYSFVKGDIADGAAVERVMKDGIDVVINFAAESHVDRSIMDPNTFIRTNVLGTNILLSIARENDVKLFIQISTDEVYGSLGPEGLFTEESPLDPTSPYSASKTSADLLALAYHKTYGLPVIVTRCSNNYGPYQFPEKLIPLFITNAMENKPLPVYGDGMNIRDWIHTLDHSRAVEAVMEKGKPGEVYNIGGNNERTNLEITERILKALDKPKSLIRFVKDRPGHDKRYAIDSSKITSELGWKPKYDFEKAMNDTVSWYRDNRSWWEEIKSGKYQDYYLKLYGKLE
ncbi:MAG: dTDP-glucose 4,6-dehydratase [Deltaproteobacteria bacterium]|uniref:dTDP-glucose 4,6-dehydratase n=1 Tax=Candidatus Zymogenus saltonus TaxID=2844893 RepID=A0A9D8KD43_9DELT|nr:dTDP-glucose 4,6-dehydratase [Candidatus Zymogenus saltonus]